MTIDCPICICPLSLENPIGVCAPCGHPFHPPCYYRWHAQSSTSESDRTNGKETRAKCPSCNLHVDAFADNVFLGLQQEEAVGDYDSSVSSSDDSDFDENDDGGKGNDKGQSEGADTSSSAGPSTGTDSSSIRGDTSSTSMTTQADNDNDDTSDEPQVICIDDDEPRGISTQIQDLPIDLSQSPPRPTATSSTRTKKRKRADTAAKDAADNESRKWKTKAKKYKRRVRALEVQSTERNEHHIRLMSRLSQIEEREKELEKERDAIRDSMANNEEDMASLELEVARSKRMIKELEDKYASASRENVQIKNEKAAMESNLQQIRERHRREIDKAAAAGMAEVQELLDERPKMVEENRRLKEMLNRTQAATSASSSTTYGQQSQQQRQQQLNAAASAARFAKEMRKSMNQRDEDDKREARRQKELEKKKATSTMSRKVSAQAARMSRAAKSKVAPSQRIANAALGVSSRSTSSTSMSKTSRPLAISGTFAQRSSLSAERRRQKPQQQPRGNDNGMGNLRETISSTGDASSSDGSGRSTGSAISSGLVLLGNTNSLRRSNSTRCDGSISASSVVAAARIPLPVSSRRKTSSDIRSLFARKR